MAEADAAARSPCASRRRSRKSPRVPTGPYLRDGQAPPGQSSGRGRADPPGVGRQGPGGLPQGCPRPDAAHARYGPALRRAQGEALRPQAEHRGRRPLPELAGRSVPRTTSPRSSPPTTPARARSARYGGIPPYRETRTTSAGSSPTSGWRSPTCRSSSSSDSP